jgi:HEAT repeat protein
MGCAGAAPPPRRALHSSYAFDRARAAVRLAEAGDRDAVHALVGLLEDDDAGVRFYTIAALERLCGTTHGYRYHDPLGSRRQAVERWRAALRDGSVVVRRSATPAVGSRAGGAALGGENP